MANFQKVKLKDVTTKIGSGATPRGGKDSYHKGGIPLIRSLNVYDLSFDYSNLAFIDEVQAKKLENVAIEKDDVLLNITGASVCRCTSVPKNLVPARVNQHVSIIRADKKNLLGGYLKYVLVSPVYKRELYGLARTGATREALTKIDIEKFEVRLPNFQTQARIFSVLSNYDDLIENNEKRIKALEEMAQLLYTEWFVRFKFPGHKKVKMVDSGTEYGMIPEEWEIGSISLLANVISGFPFKGSTYQDSGKYKIVTIKNVHDGKFVLNFDSFIDELPSKLSATCILKRGDVLLSLTGNVGRICVVYGQNHVLNQRVAKLDPIEKNRREYIYSLFRQKRFQQKLEAMSNGAAQQNLSPIQVKDIKVVIPKSEILDEFSRLVGKYFDLLLSLQEENQNLSKTRDLLILQLVTGKRELK